MVLAAWQGKMTEAQKSCFKGKLYLTLVIQMALHDYPFEFFYCLTVTVPLSHPGTL